MILGGAQENTLLTCEDLIRDYGDDVLLVTGPPLGPEGSLMDRAERNGVPFEIVDAMRREISPRRDWSAYWKIKRIIRNFKPDVVHTHSAKAGVLGRQAAWALRVPAVIHTVHGPPWYGGQGWFEGSVARVCEWWGARQTDAFIGVSDAMRELFVSNGIATRNHFTTIRSGMEVEPFLAADQHREAARAEYEFEPSDVVVGKVARLFPLKGHEFFIRAATELCRRFPRVKFLLVGDGVLRKSLERQVWSAGLSRRFRFAGLVPPEKMPAALSAMDMVAHTSVREGLARVLPEAMLAGKPVVSFEIEGAAEVIRPGESGLLVPPRHVNSLVSAIGSLVADEGLRTRLGRAGQAMCREVFPHEVMTRQIRELYEHTLAAKAPSKQPA
jgi:glycosyltransferase involved in cell wall biosynthesis